MMYSSVSILGEGVRACDGGEAAGSAEEVSATSYVHEDYVLATMVKDLFADDAFSHTCLLYATCMDECHEEICLHYKHWDRGVSRGDIHVLRLQEEL